MSYSVLVPLDESLMSRQIIEQIHKFLRPEDHNLTLLQVIHPTVEEHDLPPAHAAYEWTPAMYDYFEKKQELSHEEFVQTQQSLRLDLAEALRQEAEPLQAVGYQVKVAVKFGEPLEEIERYIQYNRVDLVAMTTHAREGLSRLLHGSVSGKIIHDLNVPVLLYHPPV